MRIIKAFIISIMVMSACMLLISCAKPPVENVPELYWPFPPEKPRIKFVDIVFGSLDVTGVRPDKFKRVLFGEEHDFRFDKPAFIAVNDNVFFVTDLGLIHMYDFNKNKYGVIGRGMFLNATGIAVASDKTIYVSDTGRRAVFIMKYGRKNVIPMGAPGDFLSPGGIALDEARDRVLVADTKAHVVLVYSLEGRKLFVLGQRGSEDGEFNYPYDIAVDGEGNIYVLDSGNFRVQIFDKDGKFISKFGNVGSGIGDFARPKSIALDSEGHIYVVDAAFGNFQIFNTDGAVFLSVGKSGMEPGKFKLPMGIAIDADDKVYVVDQMNRRVQIFQYLKYREEEAAP